MIRHLALRLAANRAARDVAAQLLAQRERGYPAAIAAGKLSQADADAKLRIMRAVVALWSATADQRDLPPPPQWPAAFGATDAEMLAELRLAYTATRRASDAEPGDDRRRAFACDVAFLVFDHEPENGVPRLCALHAEDQAARALSRWREAA